MNIPQAFAALALRIDTLWGKVVDIETATGKALQKLWDLQTITTAAITTLTTNVTNLANSLGLLIGRVNTVEANAILLTDRVGVLESALGGLTFDPATLKGSPMFTASQITDWFTSNAVLPDVDGRIARDLLAQPHVGDAPYRWIYRRFGRGRPDGAWRPTCFHPRRKRGNFGNFGKRPTKRWRHGDNLARPDRRSFGRSECPTVR
jgi:hypothetical protein